MNKQELMQFEDEIRDIFLDGQIRAPIHLSRGNEDQLIEIFQLIKPSDWIFSTHRSHYHALLHGIDRGWLKQEILEGRSMHIMNAEHRFMTSSIVCGCVPIAIGVAMGLKRDKSESYVWCFVGDMAAETGIFMECTKYAAGQHLPITFVVEDNGLSTNTPTQEVWGEEPGTPNIFRYTYQREFPHINAGQWVTFK